MLPRPSTPWAARAVRGLLTVLLALAAPGVRAEWRALLVGVSDYPTLPAGVQRTPGARNDVALLRTTLLQRGFPPSQVRVLADGLPGAETPTRSNILRALDDLADASGPDDVVFLHLAGHGSLAPAARPGEGPSPIFLPIDIGRWDGDTGLVERAVTRHDLRERIDRITGRGAFVWGVFDTCHAANFVRQGIPGPVVRRAVSPSSLGVPAVSAAPLDVPGLADSRPPAASGRGGAVFFYAAQAGESAVELPLPVGVTSPRPHGLFSFHVAQALQGGRPMSYRQLAQSILTIYGANPYAYATPVFTGNALDWQVLGQSVVPLRQWPLRTEGGLWMEAGTLSGVAAGAVLAVVDDPTAADGQPPLGHLRVLAVEPERAALVSVTPAGRPLIDDRLLRSGLYLRLVTSPPAYALQVAYNVGRCRAGCGDLGAAVQRLRERGAEGVDLRWTDEPDHADIVLLPRRAGVDLLPPYHRQLPPARGAHAVGVELRRGESADALAGRLAKALHAVARARNLLSLVARAAGATPGTGLSAQVQVARPGSASRVVSPHTVPSIAAGDRVGVVLDNRGTQAVDVTVLYIDLDHGIRVLFPGADGESNRLASGQSLRLENRAVRTRASGKEHLLVISRPALAGRERSDFSFLAQPSLTRTRAAGDAARKLWPTPRLPSTGAWAWSTHARRRARSTSSSSVSRGRPRSESRGRAARRGLRVWLPDAAGRWPPPASAAWPWAGRPPAHSRRGIRPSRTAPARPAAPSGRPSRCRRAVCADRR